MKTVEVRLSITAVAPLLDLIKAVADDLHGEVAVPVMLAAGDPELRQIWKDALLDTQRADNELLLSLFNKEFFADGLIAFNRLNAEPVLRACAALRLRLRGTHLLRINDETLESLEGGATLSHLDYREQLGFACFVFLDELQKILLKYLDPLAAEPDTDPAPDPDE